MVSVQARLGKEKTMRRAMGLVLSLLLMGCASAKKGETPVPPLTITVTCKDNPSCVFQGEDLFLEIAVTNTTSGTIGFPLAFVQKTGPSIRLSNPRTREETNLRTNLADFALKEDFTPIAPGQSVLLRWVIHASELRDMGGADVDLRARITVSAEIAVRDQRVPFLGTDTRRIVEKPAR